MSDLKAVILDRDGVVNEESDEFVKSPEEWIAIEGSLAAIAKLNHAKVKVFIASNQSGIARGLLDYNTLHEIHQKMLISWYKRVQDLPRTPYFEFFFGNFFLADLCMDSVDSCIL